MRVDDDMRWNPLEWVHASFLEKKRAGECADGFLCDDIPFSFLCDGEESQNCLRRWERSEKVQELSDRRHFEICWVDPATKLSLTAEVDVYGDFPAVDWVLFFENRGEKNSPMLEDIQALHAGLRLTRGGASLKLHRIRGDDNMPESFLPMETEVSSGDHLRFATEGGRPSNTSFPFFTLEHEGWNLVTALGWSGQWAASVKRRMTEGELTAGMERTRFHLYPGERVRTPRIVLLGSRGEGQDTRNIFRRFLLAHYTPKENGRPITPWTSLMNWRWWFHPDRPLRYSEEGYMRSVEQAAKLGVECHWCDASWFENGFPNGVGNWNCDPHLLPRGYKPVSDYCHQLGLTSMIWFEPERVTAGSKIMIEHPEYVHTKPMTYNPDDDEPDAVDPVTMKPLVKKTRYLFRLGDPEARKFLTDLISKCITETGIDYYRSDFNINPLRFWEAADEPDRIGMTEIRWVEGAYEFWDQLLARHPGLRIDNCASGGRRLDLETAKRSVMLWRSDTAIYYGPEYKRDEWNQSQGCGLSLYYPLHAVGTGDESAYSVRSAATTGFDAQFDLYDENLNVDLARKGIAEVIRNRDRWLGDFHPLTEPGIDPTTWMAWQLHRADLDAGLVMAFRRPKNEEPVLSVRLKGVNPSRDYEVEVSDENYHVTTTRIPGSELICGYEIRLAAPMSSAAIRYTAV